MKTTWFTQLTKREDSTAQAICYAAQEMGMRAHLLSYRPFSPVEHEEFRNDGPVLFHGGINTILETQKYATCPYPFAWFDQVRLSCSTYYAEWEEHLLNHERGLFRMNCLRKHKHDVFRRFGRDDRVFMRPDTNDKTFAGGLVEKGQFDHYFNWDYLEENHPDDVVVVAVPRAVQAEWRLFVSEGKVVAGSMYKPGLEKGFPYEARKLAEKCARKWSPHPFFVLDVCLTKRGYRVLECGSANCAGFYLADVKTIVAEMSRIAEKEW